MKNNDLSYEKALEELEKIMGKLEEGDLSLKDSLEKFKKGVELYKYCDGILKDIEGEVKIILQDKEGNLDEEAFDLEV